MHNNLALNSGDSKKPAQGQGRLKLPDTSAYIHTHTNVYTHHADMPEHSRAQHGRLRRCAPGSLRPSSGSSSVCRNAHPPWPGRFGVRKRLFEDPPHGHGLQIVSTTHWATPRENADICISAALFEACVGHRGSQVNMYLWMYVCVRMFR